MSGRTNALAGVTIEPWRPGADADLDMLADVLHAVVHDGAGVSFIVPFTMAEARRFWVDKVLPGVREGALHVLVARDAGRIVGTVQFALAWPPNQTHRAEVAKLIVHPVARRRGVARGLMVALESLARAEGRTLLTLDTWTDFAALVDDIDDPGHDSEQQHDHKSGIDRRRWDRRRGDGFSRCSKYTHVPDPK